ncbi:hypothetical protein CHS0354_018713 [Potamilus streckersoni]|uniref:NAD-dependent epimerase/dehydratase domain-containing protein n=1 Tax=Potamilus streckersoni TaxID=2493646 RepID=A0AAE0RQF7_9BIVA|nr:hypothetical protein CHS0354_018713 [Potamilus streckersoni]
MYTFSEIAKVRSNVPEREASEKFKEIKHNILVFGGNGFMGSATVEKLLRINYNVVIVNRGNWYWDSATNIKPFVKHLKCDRMQSLQRCSDLQNFIWEEESINFDAIIDFSAYQGFQISDAFDMFGSRIRRYIYISSDSVYEVCNKTHSELTREDDAVRPHDLDLQQKLNSQDSYGHGKLEAEEELQKQCAKTGVSYISLRLPDVVGPRDNTRRWWLYQLWIQLRKYLERPISVPDQLWDKPLSFVYADDVADVVLKCLEADDKIYNQAYNLAFIDTPTLSEFIHQLLQELGVDDVEIKRDFSPDALHLYPSVKLGPIDPSKARKILEWQPTSWNQAFSKTVKFYEDVFKTTLPEFSKAQKDVIRILQVHFTSHPFQVLEGLKDIYGFRLEIRDEL